MNKTIISWTRFSWNPVHGCSRVSAGCANCYAESLSNRYGWTKLPWTARNAAANVQLKPHKLQDPERVREPSRVFVNSMSDLFHPLVPDDYITQVFEVMCRVSRHTYQVLTKRPERAAEWPGPWPENIWMGTSVEDQRAADLRIPQLQRCGAAVRFLSAEPLIDPMDLAGRLDGINRVIVGGESGKSHRPMPHSWARQIRDACLASGTAYFFKQSAAYRTELGISLHEEDGTFWKWQQFPGDLTDPVADDVGHRYHDEALVSTPA